MRRAKIICTLGPSSDSPEAIESLILAGMNIARLNFSHGDYDFHRGLVNRVRAAAGKLGRPVAIMQDLQGPKHPGCARGVATRSAPHRGGHRALGRRRIRPSTARHAAAGDARVVEGHLAAVRRSFASATGR